jgi:hypothetical protein
MESCDQGGEDQDKAWLNGPVASVKGKLGDDLALMDRSNGEEQVKSRSMNQYSHVMIWSDHIICDMVGACVASTLIEMEWNAQDRYICSVFHFTGHRSVEKFITTFRIDDHTIKRGKLVCISVI